MLIILILLLVVGSIMVYLAQNNLSLATLYLGTYVFSDIPLFLHYHWFSFNRTGFGLPYLPFQLNLHGFYYAWEGQ